jgi:hypothetical protein
MCDCEGTYLEGLTEFVEVSHSFFPFALGQRLPLLLEPLLFLGHKVTESPQCVGLDDKSVCG